MRLSNQTVLASSRRYLDLIGGKRMSEPEMHAFIGETVGSYEKHVNRGFITYRKSVTEAGQFAALEWTGWVWNFQRRHQPSAHRQSGH
jgi:putrescine aminotransferase